MTDFSQQNHASSRMPRMIVFTLKLLVLIFLLAFKSGISSFLNKPDIPENYINAALLFITAHLVIDFLQIIIIHIYNRRRKFEAHKKSNFALGIRQIANIATFIAFVIAVLTMFNIHIREVLTAISIVAAAIAILSKDYVSNMINGMIIMFSDHLSLNDYIKFGNHKGRIVDITLMNIHLMNEDDDLVYIPNSKVLSDDIINYTKRQIKKVSIDFEVNYAYLDEVEELETYLIDALAPYAHEILPKSYNLKIVSTQKDSALFKFQYILKSESDKKLELEIRKLTIRKVLSYIRRQEEEASPGK